MARPVKNKALAPEIIAAISDKIKILKEFKIATKDNVDIIRRRFELAVETQPNVNPYNLIDRIAHDYIEVEDRDWNKFVEEVVDTPLSSEEELDELIKNKAKIMENVKPLTVEEMHDLVHPTIKDSGSRREFSTGAVRDIQEGKGRCDLMPLDVIADLLGDNVLSDIDEFQKSGDYAWLHRILCITCQQEVYRNEYTMLLEVAKHFEAGAKKYGETNWQLGIPTHCYIDSAVRHYLKFLRGDKDEPHDRAFVWNILCCIWTCKHKPELNDYPRKEKTDGTKA